MRTRNSIINVVAGWGTQFIKIIAGFIARTIFIKYLNVEYLGLSSTFTNILQILSFAELGIGAAILVGLYKPIADDDYNEQIALIQLYKRIYRVIGSVVISCGILITPFLNFFIKDIPNVPYIPFIFILFVLNSAISYFSAHKSTYIIAVQKNYIIRLVHSSIYVIMLIVQSVVLITTGNYIVYLLIQVLATVLENIVWSLVTRKVYPFLESKERIEISEEKKRELFVNIKAVIFFKIGNVIVVSTDNLILAKFVGIVAAGIYSNYYMIIKAAESVLGQIFSSMVASIGDLHVNSDEKKQEDIFNKIIFLGFVIYSAATVVMMPVINELIDVWLGQDYLFTQSTVVVLMISFYMQGFRNVLITFREACGLYDYTKYTTLYEAIANFILSIIFVKLFGIMGIFMGTIVSFLLFGFWKEPLVLYRHVFHKRVSYYWKKYFKYTVLAGILLVIFCFLETYIHVHSFSGVAVKAIVSAIVYAGIIVILFWKSEEFQYYLNLMKVLLKKISRK